MRKLITLATLVWIAYLSHAQSWIRQNPFPQLAELQDISFDGNYGLAVGWESTILTTDNGGLTWTPVKAHQEQYAYESALVIPGTNGQVLYLGGSDVVISMDGGQSWEIAPLIPGTVYKFQYLANGAIMAHGSNNSFYTEDQQSWDVIELPDSDATAGHFTDKLHGWVKSGSFNEAQVWVTTDGGQSWNVRDTLKHPVISSIHMINDQLGFMSARDYVYKTTDGGDHWEPLHTTSVNSILDMHVVNENEIWTCENNGFVFFTLNGGMDWQEINPNIINSNRGTGIYADGTGKVWMTGKYVSICYSENFGVDWSDQIPNSKATLLEPNFYDENIGIVGGSEGTLLRTTNGGASWELIQFSLDDNFQAAQMLNDQVMLIGASSGKVFGSIDQGETWSMLGEGLGMIMDIHAFSVQSAVVVTQSGKIHKTINGGMDWNEVFFDPVDLLFGVDFVDAQHGWACGWYGDILYTDDGGDSWDSQYHDDWNQFEDIHFTSAQEGWVVSSSFTDTIWHTTNGGLQWGISILPYKTFWHSVSFTNPDTGWIAGGSAGYGIVLRTDDGGQTWDIDHQSPEALLGIYAIPDIETVWSTGFGGNIVKFSPCNFLPELSGLEGELQPCERDTVTYSVQFTDVDVFDWTYPVDWLVYGNTNTSAIQFIIGIMAGEVSVAGKDACGNETGSLSIQATPIAVPDVMITEAAGVLTCDIGSGFYQWLLNGDPIPGANQQQYTPTVSGKYEVVVTTFATGCEIRSNAIQVVVSAIKFLAGPSLIVFPNPTDGKLILRLEGLEGSPTEGLLYVYSIDGRCRVNQENFTGELDLSGLGAGVYVVVFQRDDKVSYTKIILQ